MLTGMNELGRIFLTCAVVLALCSSIFVLAAPVHHEIGCPFSPASAVVCSSSFLDHWHHWQVAFAAIVAELVLLAGLAFLDYRSMWTLPGTHPLRVLRIRAQTHDRPVLFVELARKGIVNRKEPHVYV